MAHNDLTFRGNIFMNFVHDPWIKQRKFPSIFRFIAGPFYCVSFLVISWKENGGMICKKKTKPQLEMGMNFTVDFFIQQGTQLSKCR